MTNMYRNIINAQGLKALRKPVNVPDYHLMVGNAECLSPLPILVYQDYMTAEVANILPKTSNMSSEDIQADLKSGKLSIEDFFQNVYPLGNPIE